MRLIFFKIFFFLIFFSCINFSYSVESLGTGTAALIGGDLTDPEDDGVDGAHTNWNWTSISASSEEKWTSEGSFNVFDNKVGATNNKWCCNGPTQWISVGFSQPYILSHFTITSGNDVAGRDPDIWKIQGSNDGSIGQIYLSTIITVPLHGVLLVIQFLNIMVMVMILIHRMHFLIFVIM